MADRSTAVSACVLDAESCRLQDTSAIDNNVAAVRVPLERRGLTVENRRCIVVNTRRSTSCPVTVVVLAGALFMACGGGPSEAEFVEACMLEGQSTASQMLDKELGVTRQAFCACGANVAKSSLSADGYRAMVLEMQGKREEATAITSKMSERDQEAAVTTAGVMLEKCGQAK